MTSEPPRPAPPAPEAVAQALDLLLKAMEESKHAGSEEGLAIESSMAQLDRLVWRHEVAGEAFQLAAQTRAALFRRRRNAFIPFNRLPSEVLSAILIEAVEEDQPRRIRALQVLAQVSWQWWQTIKSDPQFWAYITPPIEGTELQIRKAGILPLRLHWRFDVRDDDSDAFKDLLQRHTGRWMSIELMGCFGNCDLQVLCMSHFPLLKYLKVGSIKWSVGYWRFNIVQFPNLEEARLPIVPVPPTSLSSSSPTPLRILHLDCDPDSETPSSDIESLLRLTPQLIELKVEGLRYDTSASSSHDAPIIDLPMLRRLEFTHSPSGEESDWIPLLAQIRSPQLEKLGLHYYLKPNGLTRQTIFNVLVEWPVRSLNRPSDAPFHSVLRNAGPAASWQIELSERLIRIWTMGTGNGRLDISMKIDDPSIKDDLPRYILPPPSIFPLPVDLHAIRWDKTPPEFWDEVLDATPSLRSITLTNSGSLHDARHVMDLLSTPAPSSSPSGPRAPFLEKLCFDPDIIDRFLWSKTNEEEAVKTMLDKRRDIFIQGGVLDPPKLVVTGPPADEFFDSSDAGSETVPEEEPASGI
ncbi:hypothetical protein FRC04_008441 [Tulasnella sp. 424]|nr:hypothetical protein FRC04_008441 [Tulasnella sp. 424]KAG8959072.1 hypothetical protein FRC05_008150 [Tulasnella sp. 425]